jgi:hypothetical protein
VAVRAVKDEDALCSKGVTMSKVEVTAEQAKWLEDYADLPWLVGLALFIDRFRLGQDEAIALWEMWLKARSE